MSLIINRMHFVVFTFNLKLVKTIDGAVVIVYVEYFKFIFSIVSFSFTGQVPIFRPICHICFIFNAALEIFFVKLKFYHAQRSFTSRSTVINIIMLSF